MKEQEYEQKTQSVNQEQLKNEMDPLLIEEIAVEELAIDGICGVY